MTVQNGSTADARDIFGAGHAEILTLTGNLTLTDTDGAILRLDPGGANRDVTLPAESSANHPYLIYNAADATENLVVKNDATSTIVTIGQGQIGLLFPDGTNWMGELLGAGVPQNGILHITGTSVPTGYAEYTAGRGFLICGLPASGTAAGTVGSAFTDRQDKALAAHTHAQNVGASANITVGDAIYAVNGSNQVISLSTGAGGTAVVRMNSGVVAGGAVSTDDVLAYIQLLGIQKS